MNENNESYCVFIEDMFTEDGEVVDAESYGEAVMGIIEGATKNGSIKLIDDNTNLMEATWLGYTVLYRVGVG